MGLDHDNSPNSSLVLRLGGYTSTPNNHPPPPKNSAVLKFEPTVENFEPSLTLGLSGDNNYFSRNQYHHQQAQQRLIVSKKLVPEETASGGGGGDNFYPSSHSHSAVSSFSSGKIKRERDLSSEEAEDVEKVSSRISDEDDDGVNARKKLRLTKEQSALLEESFKQHSTLNPKQKQALAKQLNLRPRQVEVWFQNRRARTKLKQTEVDCEFLKKCCETLTDENRRLQKELQELKALKVAQPFYMHMPAATLTMCPSCERIGGVGDGNTKNPFSVGPNKSHFYNPFTNSSAAC